MGMIRRALIGLLLLAPLAFADTFSATGLTAGSTYRGCGAWENEATPPLTATVVCSAEWSTTAAGDTTPDAFSFTDVTGQPLGSTITSNAITVSNTDAPAVVTISGDPSCVYAINAGSYVATEGAADATDTITLQVTTEGLYSDQFSCQLTVGGVSDVWYATTVPEPLASTDNPDIRKSRRTGRQRTSTGV